MPNKLSKQGEILMMTEWNIKRILTAIAIVSFIIWLPFYMFNADTYESELEGTFNQQQNIKLNISEPATTKTDISVAVIEKDQKANDLSLDSNMIKEEKTSNLGSSIKLPDSATKEINDIISSGTEDESKLRNENTSSIEKNIKSLAENNHNASNIELSENNINEEKSPNLESSIESSTLPVEEEKNRAPLEEKDSSQVVNERTENNDSSLSSAVESHEQIKEIDSDEKYFEEIKNSNSSLSSAVESHEQIKEIDSGEKYFEEIKNSNVSRAILTTGVKQKEPIDNVTSPVYVGKQAAIKLHYFTETINMNGEVLYHHWKREGQSIFKRKIKISGDRWRASTNKFIQYFDQGEWSVILETEEGDILNEVRFQVVGK